MPAPLSTRAFFRDPPGFVAGRPAQEPLTWLAAGTARSVLVRDPDAIWQVLVTDAAVYGPGKWKRRAGRFLGPTLNTLHGADHRARRLALQPALAPSRIARLAPRIAARAAVAADEVEPGRPLVLRDLLDPLSLAMAADVLLSADLGPDAPALAADLRAVMDGVPRLTPPLAATPHGRALRSAHARIGALLDRRRDGDDGAADDLVAMLGRAGLGEDRARGEILAFLLAAVDEPPSALEAAWWLLGGHPAVDARLADELAAASEARPPVSDEPDARPYLRAVVDETLRLFPPARHIDRCPARATTLAGERVRAGTNVIVSPLVTQRDPALHADPDAFRPERMLDVRGGGRRSGFLPFGAGAHACIGEPLARTIVRLTLAALAGRWRLRVEPGAAAPAPRAAPLVVVPEPR